MLVSACLDHSNPSLPLLHHLPRDLVTDAALTFSSPRSRLHLPADPRNLHPDHINLHIPGIWGLALLISVWSLAVFGVLLKV